MSMEELEIIKLDPIPIPTGLPNLDWRAKDVMEEEVRNQGASQTCWAVAAIQVLEAVWKCTYKKPLKPLCPQMLIDCVNQNPTEKEQDEYGCYELSALKVFQWLKNNEVYAEEDYPYKGVRGDCRIIAKPSARVKIDDIGTILGRQRETIFAWVTLHPVVAVLDAYKEFINLENEIYEGPKKKPKMPVARHAVAIIGYGTEGHGPNAKNYSLIMSSWGRSWAMNGVGKVSRDHKFKDKYLVRRISYPVFHHNYE